MCLVHEIIVKEIVSLELDIYSFVITIEVLVKLMMSRFEGHFCQ